MPLQRARFGSPQDAQMYGFPLVLHQKRKPDSKNGKRARGMNMKHRLTQLGSKLALCSSSSPSLPSLAFTMTKVIIDSSAARSLASLVSALLAPGVPRKSSETTSYKITPRLSQRNTRECPERAPKRAKRRHQKEPREGPRDAPERAPERPQRGPQRYHIWTLFWYPCWCQNVWFSIGFTTKTQTCDSKNGKRAR